MYFVSADLLCRLFYQNLFLFTALVKFLFICCSHTPSRLESVLQSLSASLKNMNDLFTFTRGPGTCIQQVRTNKSVKVQTARWQRGSTRREGAPVAPHWFVLCLWSKVVAESVLTSAHAASTHGQCIYKSAGLNWFWQWLNSVRALLIIIATQKIKNDLNPQLKGPRWAVGQLSFSHASLSLSFSLSLSLSLLLSISLSCVIECDSLSLCLTTQPSECVAIPGEERHLIIIKQLAAETVYV